MWVLKIEELSHKLNIEKNELKKRLSELDSISPLTKTGISGKFTINKHELEMVEEYIKIYDFFKDEKQSLKLMKEYILQKKSDEESEWIKKLRKTIKTNQK